MTFNSFLTRLRLVLLHVTLLWVLGLNHQAVAMYRLPAGKATRVGAAPRAAVIKQKVTLEATAPLGTWLAPATDAWLPPAPLAVACWRPQALSVALERVRPSALPDLFRTRLLGSALSPHAP